MKEGKSGQEPPGDHRGPDFYAETEEHVQLPDDREVRLAFLAEKAAERMKRAGISEALPSGEEIYDGESTRYRFLWDGYEHGIEAMEEAGGTVALKHTLCRFTDGGIAVYGWDKEKWTTFDGSAPPFAEYVKALPDGWEEDAAMEAARDAIRKIYGKRDE